MAFIFTPTPSLNFLWLRSPHPKLRMPFFPLTFPTCLTLNWPALHGCVGYSCRSRPQKTYPEKTKGASCTGLDHSLPPTPLESFTNHHKLLHKRSATSSHSSLSWPLTVGNWLTQLAQLGCFHTTRLIQFESGGNNFATSPGELWDL